LATHSGCLWHCAWWLPRALTHDCVPVTIYATACSIATFVDAGLGTWLVPARRYRLIMVKQAMTVAAIATAPFVMPRSLNLFWRMAFGNILYRKETS
jgi:hypothetical protein